MLVCSFVGHLRNNRIFREVERSSELFLEFCLQFSVARVSFLFLFFRACFLCVQYILTQFLLKKSTKLEQEKSWEQDILLKHPLWKCVLLQNIIILFPQQSVIALFMISIFVQLVSLKSSSARVWRFPGGRKLSWLGARQSQEMREWQVIILLFVLILLLFYFVS